jgi:hypothetical protein
MMKISLLMIVLLLGVISCKQKTDLSLVAYYPFDGNAKDYSGGDNNGVIDQSIFVIDRFGRENAALNFDGEKSTFLANVTGMPSVDSPQSILLWFKIHSEPSFIDERGADNMIALVDTTQKIGVQFGFRAPGYNTLGFDTWNWGGAGLLEAKRPSVGQWHHSVYTYDGLTHRFYINGKQTSQSTAKTQQGIPNLLMLGNYPSGNQYFEGDMDEVRIYNRQLDEHEIISLFNEDKT